jgi:hypothetical protein
MLNRVESGRQKRPIKGTNFDMLGLPGIEICLFPARDSLLVQYRLVDKLTGVSRSTS